MLSGRSDRRTGLSRRRNGRASFSNRGGLAQALDSAAFSAHLEDGTGWLSQQPAPSEQAFGCKRQRQRPIARDADDASGTPGAPHQDSRGTQSACCRNLPDQVSLPGARNPRRFHVSLEALNALAVHFRGICGRGERAVAGHRSAVRRRPRRGSKRMENGELDNLLKLQLAIAWAGEGTSDPPRLGCWRRN